jgi:hypothetical protein
LLKIKLRLRVLLDGEVVMKMGTACRVW